MTFRGENWRTALDVCILNFMFAIWLVCVWSNDLPWMTFGLECQHRCVCGTSLLETVTSQWSNRQAVSNDGCVNNSLLQGRRNNQAAKKHGTHTRVQQVVITSATSCDENFDSYTVNDMANILSQVRNDSSHAMRIENRGLGFWHELFKSKMRLHAG